MIAMPAEYLKDLIEKAKKSSAKAEDEDWLKQLKEEGFDLDLEEELPMKEEEKPTEEKVGEKAEAKPKEKGVKPEKKKKEKKKEKKEEIKEEVEEVTETEDEELLQDRLASIRDRLKATLAESYAGIEKEEALKEAQLERPEGEAETEKRMEKELTATKRSTFEIPEEARPREELSSAEREVAGAERIELESYGNVKIYRVPGQKLLYYFVPVPKPTESEKRIIRIIREAATRLITIEPYKIRDPEQRRAVYRQRVRDILESSPEIN
ncbi:MAG: hypothetical protein J7L44_02075, partial [Candidatus Diapherotrites archaeon]|nr:hypothetical protein [Candidatus Diapherotrites archaeon]